MEVQVHPCFLSGFSNGHSHSSIIQGERHSAPQPQRLSFLGRHFKDGFVKIVKLSNHVGKSFIIMILKHTYFDKCTFSDVNKKDIPQNDIKTS